MAIKLNHRGITAAILSAVAFLVVGWKLLLPAMTGPSLEPLSKESAPVAATGMQYCDKIGNARIDELIRTANVFPTTFMLMPDEHYTMVDPNQAYEPPLGLCVMTVVPTIINGIRHGNPFLWIYLMDDSNTGRQLLVPKAATIREEQGYSISMSEMALEEPGSRWRMTGFVDLEQSPDGLNMLTNPGIEKEKQISEAFIRASPGSVRIQ